MIFYVTDGVSATDNEVDLVPRGSGNYTYYTDGSVKSDANEGISLIIYDTFLRQPKEVQLTNGRKINHYYDGAGALLKTVYSTGEYWEFGGITYKNGQPYQMATPEGRAVYVNGSWQYEFFYTDHLGNARVSFGANGQNLVTNDVTDFDPFGLELNGIGFENTPENRYKFQGKEKLDWIGWIDFGNRMYDPTRGQFTSVDALADHPNQVRFSPYTAFWNNPILYTDPDGNCPSCPQGEEAAKLYAAGANVTNKDGSWTWTGKEWQDAPMVSQYKPDMADNWREGNILQRAAYGLADGVYSMFADNHLGGKGFDSYDDKIKTKLGGLMTLGGPLLSEANAGANAIKATTKGRVFWSGNGNPAVFDEATKFAQANGMTTLEMTRAGQNLTKLTQGMPWEQAKPMWERMSAAYAKGATGDIHVFHNATGGINMKSVWGSVEYPILKSKNANIIYHNIK